MALSSMTGFARSHGVSGTYAWSWEIKSVNSKGLDLKLRLPVGWDAIEPAVRTRAAGALARGSVFGNLSVSREGAPPIVRVNEPVLAAVLATFKGLAGKVEAAPPSLDGILSLKGVIEVGEAEENEEERRAAEAAIVQGFGQAVESLVGMRHVEGQVLGKLLAARLAEIATLSANAEAAPGRKPEAIKARLAEQVASLLEGSQRFDADRLHQEAILLATKADIREELDRLVAHIANARQLIRGGGAVGRRLDFLAQEFNREANTLCSKSNAVELTAIGLDLKAAIDQLREQVQNIE
jgi:uncharacterized protein (TIGR00255 family)